MEHLKRTSACDCFERCPTRPTYPEFLRAINRQKDLAYWRAQGDVRAPRNAGQVGLRVLGNPQVQTGEAADRLTPGLPRLGDVPAAAQQVVRVEVLQVAYAVRDLLSRGAVIDLVG